MRKITKGLEPPSLTKHRAALHADYDNYADKDDLRKSLFTEQRGICCYCMGPIQQTESEMKIEHNRSKTKYPKEQLDYYNLLGACLGNKGQQYPHQHCDTFKGDKDLSVNPANPLSSILSTIYFSGDGSIHSKDTTLNNELNYVLNLNHTSLKAARKNALDALFLTINKKKTNKKLARLTLQKWLNDWEGISHTGNLKHYCGVIIFWLKKKLN